MLMGQGQNQRRGRQVYANFTPCTQPTMGRRKAHPLHATRHLYRDFITDSAARHPGHFALPSVATRLRTQRLHLYCCCLGKGKHRQVCLQAQKLRTFSRDMRSQQHITSLTLYLHQSQRSGNF